MALHYFEATKPIFTTDRRKTGATFLIGVFSLGVLFFGMNVSQQRQIKAADALEYLADLNEVRSLTVNPGEAFIEFYGLPEDWELIAKTAAATANSATGTGFYVWANGECFVADTGRVNR